MSAAVPSARPAAKPAARRILSIHLPSFGLQARVRHDPSLARHPLVLMSEPNVPGAIGA
jgi:hypothetical protein